jgi:hypothetical protein
MERDNLIKKVLAKLDKKDKILQKAKEVAKTHSFMNCRLFTQLVTDTPKIEEQPRLKSIEPGAILWWGHSDAGTGSPAYLHCAVALDKNTVVQVPEWGGKMEVKTLKEAEKEFGEVDRIYKSKAKF